MESSLRCVIPDFYISKKDRSLQLVQDYRKLNQYIIKNKMLLSLIRKAINKLKDIKYFNKLDFIWRYNNIWIKEDSKWKVAFLTNKKLFELKVMYFELYNSLGIFQWMINNIFRKLLYKEVLANYINDFIIPAKTKKELKKRTVQFLKVAEKHNLCFKQSKLLWQLLTKIVNSVLSNLICEKNLIGITRELNKECLMYSYTIYITSTSPILNYIYHL